MVWICWDTLTGESWVSELIETIDCCYEWYRFGLSPPGRGSIQFAGFTFYLPVRICGPLFSMPVNVAIMLPGYKNSRTIRLDEMNKKNIIMWTDIEKVHLRRYFKQKLVLLYFFVCSDLSVLTRNPRPHLTREIHFLFPAFGWDTRAHNKSPHLGLNEGSFIRMRLIYMSINKSLAF